jgi:hypothetical protein
MNVEREATRRIPCTGPDWNSYRVSITRRRDKVTGSGEYESSPKVGPESSPGGGPRDVVPALRAKSH